MTAAVTRPAASRPSSRGWLAFFAVLAVLTVLGMALPVYYNLGQQLRPEQLAAARARWALAGPADYDLAFAVKHGGEPQPARHAVAVRGGRVVFSVCEGEPVHFAPAVAALIGLPAGGLGREKGRAVPALFDHIEALLNKEEAGGKALFGRRNFLVVVFDPKLGYPRRIVHRVRGTSDREEWDVRVGRPGELERWAGR